MKNVPLDGPLLGFTLCYFVHKKKQNNGGMVATPP